MFRSRIPIGVAVAFTVGAFVLVGVTKLARAFRLWSQDPEMLDRARQPI